MKKIENVDDLKRRLENEITITQKGKDQVESLSRLKDIARVYRGEDAVINFRDIGEKLKTQKDELKILTGWSHFDELLKGFRPQQLVVVSALTKSGKTSFLMDLTTRVEEFAPLWFPFEESAEELIRKFIEWGKEPPNAFTPATMKGNAIDWIESKIVESVAKFNSKIVIIDQLDFLVPMNGDNHSLRVGQTMRDLKSLAKKWNIVIFIICHLVKTRMDTEPTLEDLKGSSSIGQEADTVIMLWREMRREKGHVVITNNTNVSVQANRRTGKTGNVKMVFSDGKFLEQDWVTDHERDAKAEADFENY